MEFTDYQIEKLPGLDDIILDSSKLQKVSLKNFEGVNTEVTLGELNEDVEHPLPLDVPFFLTGSRSDLKTLMDFYNHGATVMGPAEMLTRSPSTAASAHRILDFTSQRNGVTAEMLNAADAVNIDVGEGLNPVMAGKIAMTNHLSPHLDMHRPADLGKLIYLIRETTGYSVPIIVTASGYDVYELTKFAVAGGADAVNLVTDIPVATLPPAVDAFGETEAAKNGCKLMVTTPLRNAEDAIKLFALGADVIGLDLSRTIPFPAQPLLYDTSMEDLIEDLNYWLTLTGFVNGSQVNDECIRAIDYNTASIAGIKLIGYDRKLPMWEHV